MPWAPQPCSANRVLRGTALVTGGGTCCSPPSRRKQYGRKREEIRFPSVLLQLDTSLRFTCELRGNQPTNSLTIRADRRAAVGTTIQIAPFLTCAPRFEAPGTRAEPSGGLD